MRRALLFIATATVFLLIPATGALRTVDQVRESVHHEVEVAHDSNTCGDLATFTVRRDLAHACARERQHVRDRPPRELQVHAGLRRSGLRTWTGHGAENFHVVANHGGEVFQSTFNSKEGPIQIIQHAVFHTDADGNVRVDRTFEKTGDC